MVTGSGRPARRVALLQGATLTLLGKPGCHLCEEMRAVVERVLPGSGHRFVEVDVRDDPVLEKKYLFEIPVLLLGRRELARHRVTEAELRERLEDAASRP